MDQIIIISSSIISLFYNEFSRISAASDFNGSSARGLKRLWAISTRSVKYMYQMSQASQVLPHHNYSISLETIPFFLALLITANVAYSIVAAVSGGVLNSTTIVLSLLPRYRVLLSQAPSCLHPSFRFFPFSPMPFSPMPQERRLWLLAG